MRQLLQNIRHKKMAFSIVSLFVIAAAVTFGYSSYAAGGVTQAPVTTIKDSNATKSGTSLAPNYQAAQTSTSPTINSATGTETSFSGVQNGGHTTAVTPAASNTSQDQSAAVGEPTLLSVTTSLPSVTSCYEPDIYLRPPSVTFTSSNGKGGTAIAFRFETANGVAYLDDRYLISDDAYSLTTAPSSAPTRASNDSWSYTGHKWNFVASNDRTFSFRVHVVAPVDMVSDWVVMPRTNNEWCNEQVYIDNGYYPKFWSSDTGTWQ